jgi:hypothetical protein
VNWPVLRERGKGMEGQWALKRSHSVVAECHTRREWLPAISRPRIRQARFDSLILVGLLQATMHA